MNRRNAIKAAIAGLAAVVGWKRAKASDTQSLGSAAIYQELFNRGALSANDYRRLMGIKPFSYFQTRTVTHDIYGNRLTHSDGTPFTIEVEYVTPSTANTEAPQDKAGTGT